MQVRMEKLVKQYPNVWFKDGGEFSSEHENTIWTGEGSFIKDYEYAFDYYGYNNTFGVHPELVKSLNKLGLYAEFYDPGTVFLYQI